MNQSKIYVGNLPYSTTENELHDYFGQYGDVQEAKIIMDRETDRSKGFAFVTFGTDEEAKKALEADGSTPFGERPLRVNIAKDNNRRSGGGGGRSYE